MHEPKPDLLPPPMASPLRGLVLVVSGAVAITSAIGAFFALRATPEPFWGWLGFEIVMLVASVVGVLLGLGRYREGAGMAAALVAMAWVVGTGMGRLQAHASPSQVLTDPWFLGRLGAAALVLGAGAMSVLLRNRASFRKVVVGGVMLVVVLAAGAFWMKTGGLWLGTPQNGAIDIFRKGLLSVLVIGMGVLFCLGSHMVIAAFQMGVPPGQPGSPNAKT